MTTPCRPSQRLAIADAVLSTDRHLSAEEVAAELRLAGASAGTATVYRTLEVLVRSGLVVERDSAKGSNATKPRVGFPIMNTSSARCAARSPSSAMNASSA